MAIETHYVCDRCGAQASARDRKALRHWGGWDEDLCPLCAPCRCRAHTQEALIANRPPVTAAPAPEAPDHGAEGDG